MTSKKKVQMTLVEHYLLLRPQAFREPEAGRVIYAAGFYDETPFAATCYDGLVRSFTYECEMRLKESGMRNIREAVREAEPHTITEIPGDVDQASLALQEILRERSVRIYPGKNAPRARALGAVFHSEAQSWHIPRHLPCEPFLSWLEKPTIPEDVPTLAEVKSRPGQGYVAVANPGEIFASFIGARVLINDEAREALFNSHGKIFQTDAGPRAYIQLEFL